MSSGLERANSCLFKDQFEWTSRSCTVGHINGPEFPPQDSNNQRKCTRDYLATRAKRGSKSTSDSVTKEKNISLHSPLKKILHGTVRHTLTGSAHSLQVFEFIDKVVCIANIGH